MSWSWKMDAQALKLRDHRSVLSWVLYLSSDRYLVLCLSADRYLVLYLCLQRSTAFISRLSTSETDRNPFHIFTHWKRNEMIIAVSGDFLWNILLSSFLKVFGVKDHDGDQPVCLKCNSFSIAPNTKCSWVLSSLCLSCWIEMNCWQRLQTL